MVNQYSKNQFHLVDGHFFVWSMTIVNHLKRGCNEMSWDTEPTICVGLIYSEVSTYVYIYIYILEDHGCFNRNMIYFCGDSLFTLIYGCIIWRYNSRSNMLGI